MREVPAAIGGVVAGKFLAKSGDERPSRDQPDILQLGGIQQQSGAALACGQHERACAIARRPGRTHRARGQGSDMTPASTSPVDHHEGRVGGGREGGAAIHPDVDQDDRTTLPASSQASSYRVSRPSFVTRVRHQRTSPSADHSG
jgi:hypothetical protein